jgi:hypothetical protein
MNFSTKLFIVGACIVSWILGVVSFAPMVNWGICSVETPSMLTTRDYITEYTTTYARIQEWDAEMVELAPRLEKMQYHLQAIHKRVLLPTLDIDMTK